MSAGDGMENGIRHQIGHLMGQMQGVIDRLDSADESRTRMHVKLEEQAVQQEGVRGDVAYLGRRMEATESKVEEVRKIVGRVEALERARATVTAVVTFFGTRLGGGLKWLAIAAGGAAVMLWREILDFFSGK